MCVFIGKISGKPSVFPLFCLHPVYERGLRTDGYSYLGLFHVLQGNTLMKSSSSGAARVGEEAESEWKVSQVRQMLIQWRVGRMCVSFYGSPQDNSSCT